MSSVLDMFRTRTKEGELKKSVLKVSDPKKDALTRFKHLRIVLDNYSKLEAKDFFEANYSHIYFIFNDNFSNVEADLKQRANRAHREDLDAILFVFEKILTLLPELIHKRWMFHSIGRILKKLLHPGNGLKIRKDGIRLFLLWYQILNENASEECHEIFLQLVPGLGKGIHQEVLYGKSQSGAESKESCSGIIISGDITPILPGSGEKLPDNITKHYFDALIYYMVSEVIKVEWKNKRMRETCFVFLFDNFKSSYLMWLLPTFDKAGDIYNPRLDLPESRQVSELESHDMPGNVSDCRYSFIKWLAHFVFISKQHDKAIENQVPETVGSEEDITENQPMVAAAENMPGSNASTLSTGSHHSELDSMTSSLCYEEWVDENDIVRSVLLTSRENINIIHESFRQAFLFSLNQSKSIKTVISVYKDWFQHADQKPIFMQEPSDIGLGHAPDHHSSLSDILEEDSSDESAPQTKDLSKSLPSLDSINNSRIRNASYLGAIGDLADGGRLNDVRAGIQKVLQVFIVNSANVFLLQTDDESAMSEQVDLCKKVINIYRYLVMNINMEQKTWEKMLQVLLCITTGVLGDVPIFNRKPTDLQKRLATPIFQTIIVTWIRANLCVFVSGQLWDQFLGVLSSLSGWPELIRQWANTMDTLTRVLAKQVYGLDLTDLPLQRLTEQKEKRRRGKSQEIPRNKSNDKSFSRSWSKNEPPNDKAFTSNAVPFERGKYKSDGAGGSKSRPDLNKQRSLSGEPSPSHSRQPSNASDSALYIRSNSDGNLADPKDLVERLKGVTSEEMREKHDSTVIPACTVSISSTSENIDSPAPEDLEVAKLSMRDLQSDPDVDSISFEHSEQDTSYRCTDSRSPSPTSIHSRSPSPISELTVHPQQKDCPTPDRDSLHIEMAATTTDGGIETKECINDMRSVLAGGSVQGWLPDNAVVLWKRMLGILGDVNQITDPENHVMVYEELSKILDTLHKIRNNLGVTEDNTFSPPPPDFIPPTTIFTPWEFECLSLPDDYKRGKLLAYQLLCQTVVKRHDVPLSTELLSQFYMCLHTGIGTRDQEIINVLVKHCGPRFFSTPLQSSTLLLKNFIQAVEIVLSSSDLRQTPRSEALSLIGSLMCFPNHYQDLQVLNVGQLSVESLSSNTLKECIISQLLNSAKKESAETARCIALSSIGVYLYEELCHQTLHSKLHEAVIVLLGNLRCKHKVAAKTATAILSMLCDHTDQLLNYHAALPKHIIEVVTATVSVLIPLTGIEVSQEERKLIVAMLFCVVEWCMKMPISLLLETTDTDRSCVFKVFQVLDVAVKGHSTESLSQARQLLAGMIQDSDFAHLRELHSPVGDYKSDRKSGESDSIQCAAKLLINHMVNHMCHFPMGSGASRLSSSIQEHHDMEELEVNDLKQEIFYSSNIQFFVQNKRTLVSFIELPALVDLPGGGVTAGLTTARTVCRVLLRDLTGKYAWESSMLYAPPWCQEGSSVKNAKALLDLSSASELEPLLSHDEHDAPLTDTERPSSMMPLYNLSLPHQDNLNDMLRYIGHTSPECHLIPGEPLNLEAGTPEGFSTESEEAIKGMVIHQKVNELQYYSKHKMDQGMLAKPQVPCEGEETTPPFQMCRMMLDQLGLLAWEQRCHFDLLRKSDKLLRELKNLDNQKCRETHKIAVIYVAEGQEDKNSILSNCGASKAFEDFVAGLGWEVDLETHQGFLGGLQQNRTTGNTAPYYATSLTECIFHVSTRMPSGTDDAMHIKMRHLGNDEIHIIWSEHTRDYRRGIIPTEFGDVLIIIYPLPSGLYRIEINKKAEVPYFGPLFDGAILDRKVLPGLVRATAINASRVKRSLLPFYHSFYEERAKNFETVIQQHVDFTMFEDFAANVFAPVLPQNATIMDQSQDLSFTASMTSVDQSQSSAVDQVSPAMPRQSRGRKAQSALWHKGKENLVFY